MSMSNPGKPTLTVCPNCKLAYAVEKNPDGCPYCAKNPNLGKIAREREQEERARQGTIWPMVMGWFADSTVRLGGIVVALMSIGLIIWFWVRASGSADARTESMRSLLIENECKQSGAMPGTSEFDACVQSIGGACDGMPLPMFSDCVRDREWAPMRVIDIPPPPP